MGLEREREREREKSRGPRLGYLYCFIDRDTRRATRISIWLSTRAVLDIIYSMYAIYESFRDIGAGLCFLIWVIALIFWVPSLVVFGKGTCFNSPGFSLGAGYRPVCNNMSPDKNRCFL